MRLKKCFKCGVERSLDCFYRHPKMADGHLGKCKGCAKSDVRANYVAKRERYAAYERTRFQDPARKSAVMGYQRRRRKLSPEKQRAHDAVRNAVKRGDLVREPCEVCGVEPSQAHHEDYSKPLDVRWLCFKHHRAEHGQVVA